MRSASLFTTTSRCLSTNMLKAELHDQVYEYMLDSCGEPYDAAILHEEIDHPEKRSELFEQFMEYINDQL
jgi:hypothetical protein